MKNLKTQLLALLIIASVAPAQAGVVGRMCEAVLTQAPVINQIVDRARKAQQPIWEANLAASFKYESRLARLYSFLRLMELSARDLNLSLHELDSVRRIRKTLEVTDIKFKEGAQQTPLRVPHQRIRSADQYALTGLSLGVLHVKGALDALKGFFWALGPGIYRTAFFINSGLKDADFRNIENASDKAFANKAFLKHVARSASMKSDLMGYLLGSDMTELLGVMKPQLVRSQNMWRSNRVGWSLFWSAFTIGLINQAPIDIAATNFISTISDEAYLRKIDKEVRPIQGKVLILYAENLFPEIDGRESPPMAASFGHYLKDAGQSEITTRLLNESNANEVLKDTSQFDSVIVFVHGNVDRFNFSKKTLERMKQAQLKEGAALIFVSCLIGQKDQIETSEEKWVQLSDSMLNGGSAVVSTQILRTHLNPEDAGPRAVEISTLDSLKVKAKKFYIQQSGIGLSNTAHMFLDGRNNFYFNKVGLRVYDDKTKEDRFLSIDK